ncbi:hypothetical protein [Streptomyces sp. NPDC059452]|uniref:hypothetical protein n=1 Tax=Streptomyces sp. NPDC059452 TaxID=3346835 RepID=UPI0036924456
MLSTPVPGPDLRPGWAGELKWDGFRALASVDEDRVVPPAGGATLHAGIAPAPTSPSPTSLA